jgi:hypothetical protein
MVCESAESLKLAIYESMNRKKKFINQSLQAFSIKKKSKHDIIQPNLSIQIRFIQILKTVIS